jgi:hypothetical protein
MLSRVEGRDNPRNSTCTLSDKILTVIGLRGGKRPSSSAYLTKKCDNTTEKFARTVDFTRGSFAIDTGLIENCLLTGSKKII